MAAATRGLTRYPSGSMRMVESASICSEMRWMPISAVIADPARAVIMIAASTGPISRIRVSAMAVPSTPTEPNLTSTKYSCRPSTMPVKKPTSSTI